MHVLNIHDVNKVSVDPVEPPVAGPQDVVVKVKACGICGSDLSYIKIGGMRRALGEPTPLGHEAAGEILSIGADVSDVAVGQRVVINPMMTPSNMGNGGPDGAFCEQVRVRDARLGDSLLPIPEGIPFEIAALAEPLAVSLHGVNQAEAKPGDKVVVFGCGPIGLGMIIWLVDRGVTDVIALDVAPERLERALALGARAVINPVREDVPARLKELHGTGRVFSRAAVGTDVFIDAAGAPNILSDVVRMAKYKSRMVVTAAYMKPVEFDVGAMLTTEMVLTTAVGYPTEMNDVLAAMPRLQEKFSRLISHRVPFAEVLDGLKLAGTPQSAKVMVCFA
jgi:(R,R)-butanediol dehydrogenase / meso-butanediol dehydrogenase / diacetyl reductase